MKHNSISVTILIPAHNEQANIGNLLESIARQRIRGLRIDGIIVLCDGCTDDTARIVEKFARTHTAVRIVNDGKRLGKHRRLVAAFRKVKSTVAVVFDGDTLLSHPGVLQSMIAPFADDGISLVGGNNIPVVDSGLENYLLNAWTMFWFGIKQHVRQGNNIHNVRSCCLAMRMSLLRDLEWPEELQSHGQFLYLETLRVGKRFVFAHDAIVWYRNPTTFEDFAIQKKRGVGKWKRFSQRFGSQVYREYEITVAEKIAAVLALFFRHPVNTVIAGICKIYIGFYFINKSDSARDHFWKIAQSTKKGISMDQFKQSTGFFTF